MDINNKKKTIKGIVYGVSAVASILALIFSLLNVSGNTGLVGPQGEKGDAGLKGDTGAKGDAGSQGEKGETGEKGDTGAKGETGDKGSTGSSGSAGSKGADSDVYYNCRIYGADNGYVTVDKGSEKVGEEVTFKIIPDNGYGIYSLKINGEEVITEDNMFSATTITKDMVENGFVVEPTFAKLSANNLNAVIDVDTLVCYDDMEDYFSDYLKNYSGDIYYYAVSAVFNFKLLKDTTIPYYCYFYYTTLNIDLNNKTLNTSEIYAYYGADINVFGGGTIISDGYNLFYLYPAGSYGYTCILNVGEGVTTKCTNGPTIHVLTYDGYSNGSKITYKGKDESVLFLYTNNTTMNETSNPIDVLIDGAEISGRLDLTGYADYIITNSTFTYQGTAIDIRSGNITLTGNEFKPNIPTSYAGSKSSCIVLDSSEIYADTSILFANGLIGNAGFGTFNISNNTFETPDCWNNYFIYDISSDSPISPFGDAVPEKVLNLSDFRGKISGADFSYTYDDTTTNCSGTVYFKTIDAMYDYTLSDFKCELGIVDSSSITYSFLYSDFNGKYCTKDESGNWSDPGDRPVD